MSDRFQKIYGNKGLKKTLRGFTERKAFPHALIFSGPEGSGKTLIATHTAMAIACEGAGERPCGECEACRKIEGGISPDVITVTTVKDRRTIGVEAVREIRNTAYIHPNDLSVKVYIIKEAEKMTSQAQNALLKLFEEPPRAVYFILLASSPASLLPTVRSRAPELRTELFSDAKMTELLLEHSKKAQLLKRNDPAAFERALHAAAGSYGQALSLVEGKNKKITQSFAAAEALLQALSGRDKAAFLLQLLKEASDREAYSSCLRLLQLALRDMTVLKRAETVELTFFAEAETAHGMAERFSLPTLIRLSATLETLAGEASETNVNLRTAAVVAAERLWELK